MTTGRMLWFDANRVCAALGVVLIHSTTDFSGGVFPKATPEERIVPVLLRSVAEFSGSEMFFFFSLFLMAMRVDRRDPSYGAAISEQARRLLVPFAVWTLFYAFFRLMKADALNYAPQIWEQLCDPGVWLGYFILGKSQYHMHFLPTLFLIFMAFSASGRQEPATGPLAFLGVPVTDWLMGIAGAVTALYVPWIYAELAFRVGNPNTTDIVMGTVLIIVLLEAVRRGRVLVANALGSGVLESPGLPGFLPAISEHLLGEELLLPSIASWWCGEPPAGRSWSTTPSPRRICNSRWKWAATSCSTPPPNTFADTPTY